MNQLERLYHLLPSIYRQRDLAQGEPLRALLAVMESQLRTIEADIDGLYENWFIETCDEWVVPYIADLLGIDGLNDEKSLLWSQRSYVANTIAYRRRKGTPAILENITFDVTGWRAKVVEFFELLSATQNINHIRLGKSSTIDIRHRANLEQLNSPFDAIAHLVDVRRISPDRIKSEQSFAAMRGKYNISNLGLFVWRLQSYPITNSPAYLLENQTENKVIKYTFHPLGYQINLFNRPQTKTEITQFAQAINLPGAITQQAFAADLKAYQQQYKDARPEQQPPDSQYYGPNRSFNISNISPMQLVSMDLSNWQSPESGKVAVDVKLGRIAFPINEPPTQAVNVSYCYSFSGDIGGGPYDRQPTLATNDSVSWYCVVSQDRKTLQDALKAYLAQDNLSGIIEIADNQKHELTEPITLKKIGRLTIQAANGMRPIISCGENQLGVKVADDNPDAALTFNGILIDAKFSIQTGLKLKIIHCTLIGGVEGEKSKQNIISSLQIFISHSIVGALQLPEQIVSLTVQDSIINSILEDVSSLKKAANDATIDIKKLRNNADLNYEIATNTTDEKSFLRTTLERTTIFGKVNLHELTLASNVIFTAPVTVKNCQTGSVRFSYVPKDSQTPRRYCCQPLEGSDANHQIKPLFTSVQYGDPGYAQLALACAPEIATGADDGGEMGAFHLLHQPQRTAYLRLSLEEYLPAGSEAGIFYMS
ncbi:phage tail protein [Nostoc parmelioides]|uniref:Phage tail protein n=1 Tax=Nostoc parmelioides FACHB-3921 TaxID=2692909 RepID=A0ABR8BI52_9NOSO|nr:phage tail protein [Nostoc parmelioides]MBD2253374.1 hypothetical protein [Nostoc parmelioides FACHB-3921]